MYKSQGVSIPEEQVSNKRTSTSEEVKEPEWYRLERENTNESDSEETESDSGEWETDSEGDSIGKEGLM